MSALEQIRQRAAESGLRFVLIGGLAVIQHGYGRLTVDIDLLVSRDDHEKWRRALTDIGYQLVNQGDTFHQFKRGDEEQGPLDLMLVGKDTFEGLIASTSSVTIQGAQVLLVSLEHLIALKLHVLKQARLHRFLKDFQDVIELVRINHLDLHSEAMRGLFIRYGTADLYDKITRAVEK